MWHHDDLKTDRDGRARRAARWLGRVGGREGLADGGRPVFGEGTGPIPRRSKVDRLQHGLVVDTAGRTVKSGFGGLWSLMTINVPSGTSIVRLSSASVSTTCGGEPVGDTYAVGCGVGVGVGGIGGLVLGGGDDADGVGGAT